MIHIQTVSDSRETHDIAAHETARAAMVGSGWICATEMGPGDSWNIVVARRGKVVFTATFANGQLNVKRVQLRRSERTG